jgi:hypothetical protein
MSHHAQNPAPNAPPLARGWRRHHELRKQDAAERDRIAAALLDGPGRPPTEPDKIAAEQIAALTVWARMQERRGDFKGAAATRQQLTQAWRASPTFKPQPAAAPSAADRAADFQAEMRRLATPSGGA